VLTLVVTPSMLMVFTRARRKDGERRSFWSRLFRRGDGKAVREEASAEPAMEPAAAFPKAAE
jgi:multidrug efflux pump